MKINSAPIKVILLVSVSAVIGVGIGWVIWGKDEVPAAKALRLGGYDLISPLLVCNVEPQDLEDSMKELRDGLNRKMTEAKEKGQITSAAVYMRLKGGQELEINGEEKFSPASLRKVPLLMALYKTVEKQPDILNTTKIEVTGKDQNGAQEIKPAEAIESGKTYLLNELVEKMIKYSDNNSASLLVSLVGSDALPDLFNKLQIPFTKFDKDFTNATNQDSVRARDIGLFFRVLFNATYLNSDLSEKIMQLLTEVDYKNGLVAGVPSGTKVAHKFGLWSISNSNGQVVERELHDCGVVYHPNSPYILCVMTKSKAEIPQIESFIKDVSAEVYAEAGRLP